MKIRSVLPMLALLSASALAQVMTPTLPPLVPAENFRDGAQVILERYAKAWRGKEEFPAMKPGEVGFRISGEGGGEFHIVFDEEGSARLHAGLAPSAAAVYFETDIDFLRRLDRGELNALTAMGQARGSDPIPLVPRFPADFRWTPEARAFFIPFTFHFWNREWPEVVRFGEGTTRQVHGGNAAVFFYDQGLRTAWYQIKPGMHINPDKRDQTNPFPSLVIVTRGVGQARLAGQELRLQEGMAVYIPAGMTHEFWAGEDQYAEVVLIMWGDEA